MIFEKYYSVSLSESNFSRLLKKVLAVKQLCKDESQIDEWVKLQELSIYDSAKASSGVKTLSEQIGSSHKKLAFYA